MKNRWICIAQTIVIWTLVLTIVIAPTIGSQNCVEKSKVAPQGWSDDINLSKNSKTDHIYCNVGVDGDNIHAIWEHTYIPGSDWEVVYARSNNGGKSWTSFINISQSNVRVTEPKIDVCHNNIHTVWEDWEGADRIDYRNSTDGGQTWNNIKRISSPTGASVGNPDIFVNNSNVHILWHDFRVGTNGQVFYRRSLNGGTTFDNGQGLDIDRQITFSPSTIGAVDMAGDGSNISAIWLDERNGNWELYWMISKDNGFSWQDGLGHIGQDRRLTTTGDFQHAIAVNGSNIYIAYTTENWPGPTYNIYYLHSADSGATWNPPILLSGPNTASYAPNIGVSGDNVWVLWNDNRDGSFEIFFKNSTDGGTIWGSDTRLTNMDGFDSGGPKIALSGIVKHIIWEDQRDGNSEIYFKRYPDFPDTTPPAHSNEMPPPESYKDPPGTTISVRITDPSGVTASSIKLYVNGSLIVHNAASITDGYNVSYVSPGYDSGVIACRIIANDTLGNHLDYTWSFTVLNAFKIPVVAGWNLISMPLISPNSNLPSVLQDRNGDTLWDRAMFYNVSATTDHWKQFNIGWSTSLNDLKSVNNRMGLWLNVTVIGDGFLNITGLLPTVTQISLRAGWNLVGYPTLCTNITIATAFWGTGADIVEVFDQSATYRTKVVGPSYVMKPGEAYWVHVPADTIWTVNW